MAFCKNCGLELEEGTSFCPNCGTNQASVQSNAQAPNPTPAQSDTTAQNNIPQNDPNATTPAQDPNSVNTGAAPNQFQPQNNIPGGGYHPNQFAPQNGNLNNTFNPFGAPIPQKASGVLNVASLVWSIINLICCCQFLFGIIALVMTVMAQSAATAEEEAKKLKTARIMNILGTIFGVIFGGIFGIPFTIGFIEGLKEGAAAATILPSLISFF